MIPPLGTTSMHPVGMRHRLGVVALLATASSWGGVPLSAADVAAALSAAVGHDAAALPPDPLAGSPWIDPTTTGPDAETILASLVPPRSDAPLDWVAPLEPLHACGEPRVLPACVPPPPCHPALPPRPLDLVGVLGEPTCGPIYRGPCAPRTGSHDDGRLPRLHRVPDRLFDWFYRSR